MDNEYLQNVLGSPYVNEGAFDRLKAKGAQTIGGMGAMAGYQVQNPAEIKLKSLWGGFVSSLEKVMTDWKSQVSPMLGADVKLDATSRQIRKNLDSLAQTLTPYDVGAYRSTVKPNPAALKTLTKEGIWDAAKRSMGLNKALSSNNPMTITNSYKNYVLSLFQNFMKDAVKSTGLAAQQIYKTLAKIQPKENGWQAAGNMQRVVQQLQKLQTPLLKTAPQYGGPVPPHLSPSTPSSVSAPPAPTSTTSDPIAPSIVAQKPSTIAPSIVAQKPSTIGSTPPVIGSTLPQTPSSSNPPLPSSEVSTLAGDDFDIPTSELPRLVVKAFRIIVDAAKSDEDHALGLFGITDKETKIKSEYPKLATSWGSGPSITAVQENQLPGEGPEGVGYVDPDVKTNQAANDAIIHKEYPGEFLYNFHSRFNKYPSQPFSIPVTPVNESPDIKDGSGNVLASVEVWWQGNSTFNKIFLVEVKEKKKSKPTLFLRFSDHYVSAKSGAATPGHQNFFNLTDVVEKSNPNINLTADPSVRNAISQMNDDIFRSLLVTTHRKSMEFVSRGWKEHKAKEAEEKKANVEMPTSMISPDGTLTYTEASSGKQVSVTKEQLKTFLKGPMFQAKSWRDRLESVDYFDKFPDMPSAVNETQIWKDAHMALVALGFSKNAASKELGNAWMYLKDKYTDISVWPEDANITSEQMVKIALKKAPTVTPKPPTTPSTTTPSPEPSDATVGEKPAVETPKEAPVVTPSFKQGDVVDVDGLKVKIKDISANNVVVVDDKGTPFTSPIEQWNGWVAKGKVKHTIEKSNSQPTNTVSAPVSQEPDSAPISKAVSSPVSKEPSKKPLKKKSGKKDKKSGEPPEKIKETFEYLNPFRKENFLE